MTTIRVAVGSTNPCKIEAVRKAFCQIFSSDEINIEISSHSVPSGVADQPFGDEETRDGAMNRALAAYNAEARCDFGVGLEGGLEKTVHVDKKDDSKVKTGELWCMAWMAIVGSNSQACTSAKAEDDNYSPGDNSNRESKILSWGYAKTGSFLLPPALCELVIHQNMELGHADDVVFQRVNSKHGSGTVGILTKGEIDRTEYYVHALKLALIPWIRPTMYISTAT